MFGLLLLVFLVVPIVEFIVIVEVATRIGTLETIVLLIVVSFLGAWLVRREGLGIIQKIQTQLASGKMPGQEMVDGALVLFAGALLLTPGFITDAIGLLFLFPPSRVLIRKLAMRRFTGRVTVMTAGPAGPAGARGWPNPSYTDVDSVDVDQVDLNREDGGPGPALP